MNILYLPIEIINEILQYLTTKEICNSLLISKSFQKIFLNKKVKLNLNFFGTKIYDDYLKYFKCIHIINLSKCKQITDKGLEFLKGIYTIDLSWCNRITDNGLKFLKGVHTINLSNCNQITDKGLEFLKTSIVHK